MAWPLFMTIVVLALASTIILYNRLIRDRNRVQEGWSGIDVQLKKRYDLIPKLVQTVEGAMSFEKSTLIAVTELRAQGLKDPSQNRKAAIEEALSRELLAIMALVEKYPDLKTNQNFLSLQQQISEVEDHLQMARRYYNGAVRNYNIRLETFPSLLIARLLRMKPAAFFESDAPEKESLSIPL